MGAVHEEAGAVADAIERELARLGRWSKERPADERFVDMGPFGMNTLAAEEWIQFVLVPRIRELVAAGASLPAQSSVATWATRNFDGDPDAGALIDLLRRLDRLCDPGGADEDGADDEPPARPDAADASGTNALDVPTARLTALLRRRLAALATVRAAYLAQLFFPNTRAFTTPIVALALDGPIDADAFRGMPEDTPFVAMVLGDDAVSRLLRLGSPFYERPETRAGDEPARDARRAEDADS